MIKLRYLAALVLVAVFFPYPAACQQEPQVVLLVSFDGFRHDYVDKHDLKNFKAFRAKGTSAAGIVPCYPSSTFPNHYSIVTGLRPGSHGLVDNSFFDSVSNISYTIGNRAAVTDKRFYGGVPLWTLARRAGLQTASYFWVGSEVQDESVRPHISYQYDAKVPFKTQIDTVLAWLRQKSQHRPRFITLYFSEPDHTTHETGVNSVETRETLLKMDSLLGYMMQGIASTKAPVNTILVSDHGMYEIVVADDTNVFLDEIYNVKSTKVRTVVSTTLAHLYIEEPSVVDSIYNLLKSNESHYKVYRKTEFPSRWYYDHYRAGQIVIAADAGHTIRLQDRAAFNRRVKQGTHFGVHGYDPFLVPEMHGIFMAAGPRIKRNRKLGLVRNIDIYPMMARILGLGTPPIDGDPKALRKVLK